MQGFCTVKTVLSHGLLTGFLDLYICMNICISERYNLVMYPFESLFLEIKWFFHDSLTFIHFGFDSSWK